MAAKNSELSSSRRVMTPRAGDTENHFEKLYKKKDEYAQKR